MFTTLAETELGPMTLTAPEFPPRQFDGEKGHLWQWEGDGGELISLTVAVRESLLVTERGVRDHLTWEVGQLKENLDAGSDTQVAHRPVEVAGADASAAALVDGYREGHAVRSQLVVTTDGARYMYVVHALVPDHAQGWEMADVVTSGIRIYPWTMPS